MFDALDLVGLELLLFNQCKQAGQGLVIAAAAGPRFDARAFLLQKINLAEKPGHGRNVALVAAENAQPIGTPSCKTFTIHDVEPPRLITPIDGVQVLLGDGTKATVATKKDVAPMQLTVKQIGTTTPNVLNSMNAFTITSPTGNALYTIDPKITDKDSAEAMQISITSLGGNKFASRLMEEEGIFYYHYALKNIAVNSSSSNGDRPTDISFGLGPRINAVSRIHGDASFCVELLTSRDRQRCNYLAEEAELANTRRKSLQKDTIKQVTKKLEQLDLSTTSVIVLEDPQWQGGVLGLAAGTIAQEYGRPTVLLSSENSVGAKGFSPLRDQDPPEIMARGSARSVNGIDLYQLVKSQSDLLHRFGGHPFAAGLSLPLSNLDLFREGINQQLRQQGNIADMMPQVNIDLVVTVADLGEDLFNELRQLEPYGMGNPVPKLLIKNCWFTNAWHKNIQSICYAE